MAATDVDIATDRAYEAHVDHGTSSSEYRAARAGVLRARAALELRRPAETEADREARFYREIHEV